MDLTTVATYPTEDAARDAAAALVAHGVGATVEPVSEVLQAGYHVDVLDSDSVRAHHLLGLELTAQHHEAEQEEMARSMRQWLLPVLAVAVVLVLVPVIAFLVSFKLSGG
jgi:hypothetical protein